MRKTITIELDEDNVEEVEMLIEKMLSERSLSYRMESICWDGEDVVNTKIVRNR